MGWAPNKETKQSEYRIVEKRIDDKRAMYVEPEFSRALDVGAREGNVLSPILRQASDGNKLETRSKKEPQTATDPHLSLIGQITPEELMSRVCSVKGNITIFNGFFNRFLFCLSRRTQASSPPPLPTEELKRVLNRIDAAVKFASVVKEIGVTPEAAYYWELIYKSIASNKSDNLVGKLTARAEPQIMRLAMIYATRL